MKRSIETPISPDGSVSSSRTPFGSSTIMMVDDEPTTIEILEVFLEGEGYERFVKTTDSREAVDLAREHRPDLLLLDLMMPEVGGLEVLQAIRSDPELRHLPVVILTSATDPETKLRALELGATDLLAKPVDPSELALRLRNTLTAKFYQDRLAFYDRLTGLPNRRFFMERLERSLRRAKARSLDCALLHLNLDRFKQINDALGHSVGDALLHAVGERLEASLRPTDILELPGTPEVGHPLSRVGGDEFSLLLPGAGAFEQAVQVSKRILTGLTEPFRIDGHDVFITASIGIALYPQNGENIETLLRNASVALAHAKVRGRNNFQFYDPSLNAQSAERLALENHLRRAMEQKELLLHYQPKVDIATDRIIGAEALMRWEHPELGHIGPNEFIPVAEEMGLIHALGEWALRTACEQNRAWQDAGLPRISMSVNVSAMQFAEERFVDTVASALQDSQMDPTLLILELTESMIMDNPGEAARMLEAIQAMGVRTSVDDFGTGYSSLTTLQRFPIDELKIDRSFVQNIPADKDDAAIVDAVIAMGHSLSLKVVAEGVETVKQLEFLKGRGCDIYQGYLRSRPFPADDFEMLLEGKG